MLFTTPSRPHRVDRTFAASAPNQLRVADVTYLPTVQGWLYLACVTDVFSRMVIGWSMASHRTPAAFEAAHTVSTAA